MGSRVSDIMGEKLVTISADDSLSTVEDIMTLGGVRHMAVVRGGQLVGVVSERDLLRASLSNRSSFGTDERRAFLHAVEIARVMSAPPAEPRFRPSLPRMAPESRDPPRSVRRLRRKRRSRGPRSD
jgi:CBS domain-containing protein